MITRKSDNNIGYLGKVITKLKEQLNITSLVDESARLSSKRDFSAITSTVKKQEIFQITEKALEEGINAAATSKEAQLSDIYHEHGIGQELDEDPQVLYGPSGRGIKPKPGLTLTFDGSLCLYKACRGRR